MANLAQLPADERAPARAIAEVRRAPRLQTRYYAFLSYSHKDKELADWLHRELERFRVPRALAGRLTQNGIVPKRLTPIFRDQQELAAAGDLAEEIKAALAASQFLVVLCSPTAAKSRWTNAEIESFKRTRPEGCVLAAIVAGEPFASDVPGREDEECFPPALKYKYDRRGHQTHKRAEPLAADMRGGDVDRRLGLLKLIAGMLGVGLDELVQRETTRRQRRLAWLAAASFAGMAVTSTLAVTAIQARDSARDQRREAEGLISFMLGDLRDKLEPVGRLDALDGVGAKVLAYYQKQDKAQLSDASLSQRSGALSLMAAVATSRGNLDGALHLYREAQAGTAEAIRRDPNDPQRLFDHAQNIFYVGEIERFRGNIRAAEAAMREYKRLALQMVQLDPNNMKWRMEVRYADANLGVVLYSQRRFAEATRQFQQALGTIQALATADPDNLDYQKGLAEGLAWLADAQSSEGQLDEAAATRERHIALLNRLLNQTRDDVYFRLRLIPAERSVGNLYASRGHLRPAIDHLQAAVAQADRLLPIEPANTQWREYAFDAQLNLARLLFLNGQRDEAAAHAQTGCDLVRGLLAKDPSLPKWRAGLRDCWMLRARMALAGGGEADALQAAQRALSAARSVKTSDPDEDRYALATAYRLLGDVQRDLRNDAAARAAWTNAFTTLPSGVAEQPEEMAERARILQRLGRSAEADPLNRRLAAIGYRSETNDI